MHPRVRNQRVVSYGTPSMSIFVFAKPREGHSVAGLLPGHRNHNKPWVSARISLIFFWSSDQPKHAVTRKKLSSSLPLSKSHNRQQNPQAPPLLPTLQVEPENTPETTACKRLLAAGRKTGCDKSNPYIDMLFPH